MSENIVLSGRDGQRLRATKYHPTYNKFRRLCDFLNHLQLSLEVVDGDTIKIRDHEFAVNYDLLDEDNGASIMDVPPIDDYRLSRDKYPNRFCPCPHCGGTDARKDDTSTPITSIRSIR